MSNQEASDPPGGSVDGASDQPLTPPRAAAPTASAASPAPKASPQQLIRLQPQQVGQAQVLQQNVVRVSALTPAGAQQQQPPPKTVVVIGGSPQRLQAQPGAATVVQAVRPAAEAKSVQEHGYAVKAPLTHHDYALPKVSSAAAGEKAQVTAQPVLTSLQLVQQPGQTLVTQPVAVTQQHQQQQQVVQLISPTASPTAGQQAVKPLTATLQGGQLVVNQQQLVQAGQPGQAGQPVTLRLQMKDISSLQKNISKLQPHPQPAKVATVVRQAAPKQQAAVVTSQPQFVITNVNSSAQLQGIVGAQQIKIVPSAQQVQQPQQHVLKQLPGGGFALSILPSSAATSGTTLAKTVTISSSPQSVRIVGSAQSTLAQAVVCSSAAAKTVTVAAPTGGARAIVPTGMITKTITIPASQQIIRPSISNQPVAVTVLPQSSGAATLVKTATIPTSFQALRTVNSQTVSKTLTIPSNIQTVRAVAPTPLSAQTAAVTMSSQTVCSVLPSQSVAKTVTVSSAKQIASTVTPVPSSAKIVAIAPTVQTASTAQATAVASSSQYTLTSMGNITIQTAKPAAATTATGGTAVAASVALQKAVASLAASSSLSAAPAATSTSKTITVTTKNLPNIIRSPAVSQSGKPGKQAKAKAVAAAAKPTAKTAKTATTSTTITKPIQIPGQPVGQQPGQILIMVNPGRNALEEVKKIAQEVSKFEGLPRSTENIQKLKELQTRVRQLQSSVQTVRAKQSGGSPKGAAGTASSPSDGDSAASGSGSRKEGKKHKLQEKANRIVAEAVARAKASGLQNIPKIMADVSLPEVSLERGEKKSKEKRKARPREPKPKKAAKPPKEKALPKPRPSRKRPRPKKVARKIPAAALVRLKNKRKHLNDSSSSGSEAEDALLVRNLPDDSEYIEKRRSCRNTKRKRYDVEYDFNITDNDSSDSDKKESDSNIEVDVVTVAPTVPEQNESAKFFVENPDESEANLVEKILCSRTIKKPQLPGEAQVGEIEEFYVKYKNFSYLHCEWATFEKLQKGDQRIYQKIKRYRLKLRMTPSFFSEPDDELFNPDYIQPDRILDVAVTEDPDTQEKDTHYLVKWRGLPYEESTWELEQDVDGPSIGYFKRTAKPPPSSERERKDRAGADDWTKLEETPVYNGDNTLRDYQLEGVNWLMFSWCNRQNCILADEMGLGKTIQALAFVREVQKYGIQGPFLIIAPLSTIANWQREFETWTNINAVVYHGSAQSRHMIAEYEMFFKDSKGRRIPNIYKFQVFITTYEIVLADCQELSEIEWRLVIIDEAHRLKNRNCKLLEGLRFLDIEHRVLLTGTPLQNNIDELFSLLNFLEPVRFRSISQFLGDFGDLKTESQVEKLQQLLKPMMLRRLKEDVEKNLAQKEETIIEVELTNIQKKYYRAILERNFSFLSKGTNSSSNLPNLMNTMMELRKCCNHPFLINGAEEQIMTELAMLPMNLEMTQHMRALIQSAGKMVLLDKLLPRLREGGHKVLIFSQMIRCLDILEDYLVQKRYPFERIDGRVRGNLRQAAIDRFSKPESDRFVFLLCTRAGGLGINLTAADTCIIFDSDWNPQNDLQAQARCHRIGQTKSVKIYRLITRNSYEREMFDKASMKLGLDKAVLQSMRADNQSAHAPQPFSKKEIEDLLRKGAYGAIMEDDDAASKFCQEDIEMILQRRTQIMKIEAGQKGSTFAKASFALPEDQRSDIKLDDPDFWAKWARKAELDIEALKKRESHVINTPRKRKQTRRFGNMDEMVEFTSNDDDSEEDAAPPPKKGGQAKGAKGGGGGGGSGGAGGAGAGGGGASGSGSGAAPIVAMKPMKPCKSQLQSGWTRLECFRVEKGLLTYGWGRWEDVLMTTRFKRPLGEKDVEAISRTMLIFCLKFYKGDENIKSFIWDLVTPAPDGSIKDYKNHKGLSAPVPRGRKSKKPRKEEEVVPAILEYDFSAKDQDPETLLTDQGYKNHLKRHCNKVLLRVRLLYYLKQEVIGDMVDKIADGADISELPLSMVQPEGEPPISWWDVEADRSLLVGVFKHGYERYAAMRSDLTLCFHSRCGAPDKREIARENADNDDSQLDVESMEPGGDGEPAADLDIKPVIKQLKEEYLEDGSLSPSSTRTSSPAPVKPKTEAEPTTMPVIPGKLAFPLAPDVNTRLRRLVAAYQRNHKRQQQKQAKRARREMVKQVRFEEQLRQRQLKKQENAQKWSRREEADFYRVLATFGVEKDPASGDYDWSNFRKVAKLERKYDHRLLEYYQHFRAMCLKKCKREEEIPEDFASLPAPDFTIENISEERANKVLHRIDLLLKIRNEVLPHPEMVARMRHCRKSLELPDWWELGIHDRDLVIGVARYGINRMESQQQMLADPDLSFKELKEKYPLMVPVPLPPPPAVKPPAESPSAHGGAAAASGASPCPQDAELRTSGNAGENQTAGDDDTAAANRSEASADVTTSLEEREAEDGIAGNDSVQTELRPGESDESGIEDNHHSGNEEEESTQEDAPAREADETGDSNSQDTGASVEGAGRVALKSAKENSGARGPGGADPADDAISGNGQGSQQQVGEEEDDAASLRDSSPGGQPAGREGVGDGECGSPKPSAAGEESDLSQTAEAAMASSCNMTYAFLMKWPKDRVIVHRLENICHCVLKNCWPGRRQNHHSQDSAKAQLAALSKQRYEAAAAEHLLQDPSAWDPSVMPPEHNYAGMADGLLALVQQRKRKRRRKMDPAMDRDLGHPSSLHKAGAESPLDLSQGSSRYHLQDGELERPDSEAASQEGEEGEVGGRPGLQRASGEPGRRPTASAAAAAAEEMRRRKKRSYLKVKLKTMHGAAGKSEVDNMHPQKRKKKARRLNLANFKDDDHVPVYNRKTGLRLCGEAAPLKKDLMAWFVEHQDFAVQNQPQPALENSAVSATGSEDSQEEQAAPGRVGNAGGGTSSLDAKPKRQRLRNPAKMDLSKLTGEERVGIVEPETGRKLSAKLVPTLRNLAEWLVKHPGYAVASDWGEVVRAKGDLPAELHSRIMPSPVKSSSPLIQPALYPAVLAVPNSAAGQSFPPANHLASSAADLANNVSMQIGGGGLGGLALSGFPTALGLGALPIGVAPIASLAGLEPPAAPQRKDHLHSHPHHPREKVRKRKAGMPRKILSAERPAAVAVSNAPAALAGISPFLLPSTAGMYYSPFLATQGLVPTALPADVAGNEGVNGGEQLRAAGPQPEVSSDDDGGPIEFAGRRGLAEDGEKESGDSELE